MGQGAGPDQLMDGEDVGSIYQVGHELVLATLCMLGWWDSIHLGGHGDGPSHLLNGGIVGQHLPDGSWRSKSPAVWWNGGKASIWWAMEALATCCMVGL